MIEIKITDPANTPPKELRAVANLLAWYLGITAQAAPVVRNADGTAVLDPADDPAAGTTVQPGATLADEAHRAFAQGPASPPAMLSPEAAFGGNAQSFPSTGTPPAVAQVGEVAHTATVPVGSSPAPTPAPAASAPPALPPSQGPGGVELDARGLPWDARIHAKSSQGPGGVKNSDGTWRAKRGLNDGALVARIEAELRAAVSAPAPAAGTLAGPGGQVAPVPRGNVPPVPPVSEPPPTPAAFVPPVPPVVAPPAPAAGGQPRPGYVELVQQITGALATQRLTESEVVAACMRYGIANLPTLATRLDLVPNVAADLAALLAQRP